MIVLPQLPKIAEEIYNYLISIVNKELDKKFSMGEILEALYIGLHAIPNLPQELEGKTVIAFRDSLSENHGKEG